MSSNEQTNCISRSTVIANVIIKKWQWNTWEKKREKKNKWISIKVYLLETVQHRVSVCAHVRARVSSQSEKVEALQSFLSLRTRYSFQQGYNFLLMKGTWWLQPTLDPFSRFKRKTTTSDSQCCCNCCVHLKCLYLVQKIVD